MAGTAIGMEAVCVPLGTYETLSQRTYTYQEGSARVSEHHYELPKGQHSNLVGSFSYRTISSKTGQIKARIAAEQRKLRNLTVKDHQKGKVSHKKRQRIMCKMKYLETQLNTEISKSPITKVVVRERGSDQNENVHASMEGQAYELLLSVQCDTDMNSSLKVETEAETFGE